MIVKLKKKDILYKIVYEILFYHSTMSISEENINILKGFSWEIPTGGNLENISYNNQPLSDRPDLVQQFSQPTNIPELILYFPIGYYDEKFAGRKYPAHQSILQILREDSIFSITGRLSSRRDIRPM